MKSETIKPSILLAFPNGEGKNYIDAFDSVSLRCTADIECQNPLDYDALLLPGGGDIEPSYYGETNSYCRNILPDIDEMQFHLLESFCDAKKPVLGICKGIQIINIFFGGTLCQEMFRESVHGSTADGDNMHTVSCDRNSFLYPIYSDILHVNSAHHQCIRKLGDKLLAQGYAEDKIIEALRHETLPVFGVQWHPERMVKDTNAFLDDGLKLLKSFGTIVRKTM